MQLMSSLEHIISKEKKLLPSVMRHFSRLKIHNHVIMFFGVTQAVFAAVLRKKPFGVCRKMFGRKKNRGLKKIDDDDSDPMLLNFRHLRWIGCWAIDSKVKWKLVLYKIYSVTNVSLFALLPLLEIIDMTTILDNIEKFNYNLCASAGTVMLIFKMLILMSNREKMEACQKNVRSNFGLPWIGNKEHRAIIKKTDVSVKFFIKAFYSIVIPTVITWSLIPLIDTPDPGDVVTPMRAWFPFDYSKSPAYEMVCILEAYMLYMYAPAIISIDLIFFGFVPKLTAHLEVCIHNLQTIGKRYEDKEGEKETPEQEEKTYRDLQRNVIYHQKIVDQALEFEKMYNKIVIIHFSGMALLLCVEVFDIVMVKRTSITIRLVTQLNYLISSMIDTFVYCYHGQHLLDRSEELSQATYDVPWWNMSERCKKILLHQTVGAQKPPVMTGGRHFPINLETFLAVVKLSYNILAMLEQMQE